MNNRNVDSIERTYGGLLEKVSRAMSCNGILSLPQRYDVGDRFVHSVSAMPTLMVFMSIKAHDRHGWYKIFGEIKKSGIFTTVTPMMSPFEAGATCENNSYKVAICILEDKNILLKNGWANGNIIVSVPNMDKGAVLKALVRAWLVSLIK